jgi:lipoprotein signal peptidase
MSATETAGSAHGQRRLVATIAGIVVALDAATKAIAAHALAGRGVVNLLGGRFHLELYRNFAGPGNVLPGHPVLVSVLSLIAVALIVVAAWLVRTTSYAVAIGLLLGGGTGNLLDRLLGSRTAARWSDRLDQTNPLRWQPQPRRSGDQRRSHRCARRIRS